MHPPEAIPAALATPEDSRRVTIRVGPVPVRVRVVDCRTGLPVANAPLRRVLIAPKGVTPSDAEHAAAHLIGAVSWDIRKHQFVSVDGKGSPEDSAGFTNKDQSRLHQVRAALGLPKAVSKADRAAALNALKDSLKDYNRRFIAMVADYLTAYGYPCKPDGEGAWSSEMTDALKRWQVVKHNDAKPLEHLLKKTKKKSERARTDQLLKELVDDNKLFRTDSSGVAVINISRTDAKNGFNLLLEFVDFAIVPATAEQRVGVPNDFEIEWSPPGGADLLSFQEKTGDWGWRLRGKGNRAAAADLPQFRSSHTFSVEPAPDCTMAKLTKSQRDSSGFYPGVAEPEIVLIGLMWCQPAWDDFADPPDGHQFNENVYVEQGTLPSRRHRHLHLVTRAEGISGSSRPEHRKTKGYGKLDYSHSEGKFRGGSFAHGGLDVHVRRGDPVFAVRSGKVLGAGSANGGAGFFVKLINPAVLREELWYFHLHEGKRAKDGIVAKAGQVLGIADRSGNLDSVTGNPGHTHLQRYSSQTNPDGHPNVADRGHSFELVEFAGPLNNVCIPTNDQTPLLFPCRCEMHEDDESKAIADCKFADPAFTNLCWAAGELKCPHMHESGRTTFKLQAQLRFVFENQGTLSLVVPPYSFHTEAGPFLDPGPVDGKDWTPVGIAKKPGATAQAVYRFRKLYGMIGGEMDDAAWEILEKVAPIHKPFKG